MYEIQITRAGMSMSQEKAAEVVANGYRVTVVAVSGPHVSDYWAEVMAVSGTDGETRARINFAPLRKLFAEGASAVASVAVVASEVAMTADALMAARDAADA